MQNIFINFTMVSITLGLILSSRSNALYKYFIDDTKLLPDTYYCNIDKDGPMMVMLVTSHVKAFDVRERQRRSLPVSLLRSYKVVRVFATAFANELFDSTSPNSTQALIQKEHEMYGDILQGSFIESFKNLTHKHLMALNWAATYCNKSRYIIKLDDDVFLNKNLFSQLYIRLLRMMFRNMMPPFVIGNILRNSSPMRDPLCKWFVSFEEYPWRKFPDYVSGGLYVTSTTVARQLCAEAARHPYMHIDDAFITGVLARALNLVALSFGDLEMVSDFGNLDYDDDSYV